jgi:ubiquinone biosynthesis protein COQ4
MSVLGRRGAFKLRELTFPTSVTAVSCRAQPFSGNNRPPPKYPGHVPLTFVERGALAIGSAVGSLLNPRRAGTKLPKSP